MRRCRFRRRCWWEDGRVGKGRFGRSGVVKARADMLAGEAAVQVSAAVLVGGGRVETVMEIGGGGLSRWGQNLRELT